MPRQIFTLYYNPGCSQCRAVRTLLEERVLELLGPGRPSSYRTWSHPS